MTLVNILTANDIDELVEGFRKHNWHKPREIFERYLSEQEKNARVIWVLRSDNELAGYVTLNWHSEYQPFFMKGIPELMDLNVLPPFRRQGIASKLMDIAEKEASRVKAIGLGVGLYEGYGQAQRLYVKRGYIPDGRGPTYKSIWATSFG